jgi:dCTP deaminase
MILTGSKIEQEVRNGNVTLIPFDEKQLNPNSYNYRLGRSIAWSSAPEHGNWTETDIPNTGLVLSPGRIYLAATLEIIGSRQYAVTLLGRSSVARLGLFLTATSDLGHVGSSCRWTLELKVVQPLRIYAEMRIGQVSFWCCQGGIEAYRGRYHLDDGIVMSRDPSLTSPQLL